jgi:hypothetical protein
MAVWYSRQKTQLHLVESVDGNLKQGTEHDDEL